MAVVHAGRGPRGWQERLLAGLLVTALLLAAASLVLPRVPGWDLLRDPAQPWLVLLDVRDEGSVHTWFNVALLTASAGAACLAAGVHRTARAPAWPWWAVAVVLTALSADDMLSLHERLEDVGRRLGGGEGALHFAWVVPGAALGAAVALVVGLAVRRLPPCSRTPLLAGMALLLLAALVLEVVGGALISEVGDGAAYILVSHLEELLESVGACVLAYGVLRGVQWQQARDGVRLLPAPVGRTVNLPDSGARPTSVPAARRLPRPRPTTVGRPGAMLPPAAEASDRRARGAGRRSA